MSRSRRIALNLLLPPLLAMVPLVVLWFGFSVESTGTLPRAGEGWPDILHLLPIFLTGSYVVALIPSLLFALYMEAVYRKGFLPPSLKAHGHSCAGGVVAGLVIASCLLLFTGGTSSARALAGLFGCCAFIGAGTGLLVGLVVGALERRAASRARAPG